MTTIALFLLVFSILSIIGLFILKRYEERAGRTIFPGLRSEADVRAMELKAFLLKVREELDELPAVLLKLLRVGVHDLALGFAALARLLEREAHRLADLVSHKHRFERRESKNEFLRKVTEHKETNGYQNGNGLDRKV